MDETEEHGSRLLRAGTRLVSGTFLSTLVGYARDAVLARYFGAGRVMDAYKIAFTVPNLFRQILGERTLESAFLPTFKNCHERGRREEAWRLASTVLHVLVVLCIVLAIGLYIGAPGVVRVLAPGFLADRDEPAVAAARETGIAPGNGEETVDRHALAVSLSREMLPFMPLISIATLVGAILLAFERFRTYAMSPIGFSIGVIASVVLFQRSLGAHSLSVGVLVGGGLFLAAELAVLFGGRARREQGVRYYRAVDLRSESARQVGRLAAPVTVGAGVTRLTAIVDNLLASRLVEGSVAALSYGFLLVRMPFGVIGLSLGRSVLPAMSEAAAAKDGEKFCRTLLWGLRMTLLVLVPGAVLMVLLSRPLVALAFQRGRFDETAVGMTSIALTYYSLGVVGMSATVLLARAFNALLDTKTGLYVSVVGMVLNIVLDLLLVRTALAHGGLALATSIAAWMKSALMLLLLKRLMAGQGMTLSLRPLLRPALIVLALSAVSGVAAWLTLRGVTAWYPAETLLGRGVRFLVPGTIGVAVYTALVLATGLVRKGGERS